MSEVERILQALSNCDERPSLMKEVLRKAIQAAFKAGATFAREMK